ncbi:MAG: DUF4139 domain-containing protein [Xanthomonadales bacterium]|nr:DUF4139 domain-containing protein [Xanthomonadales bacterium]MDL1870462.1 DUF4139 domain-containing protein [Gammaproteobacteria bacterium PRO6]
MRRSLIASGVALAMSTATAASPDFSITVYSSAAPGSLTSEQLASYGLRLPGYALVRDRRELELPNGTGEVRFSDVATRIDPTTVSFASITDPDGTRVIEQNYQFDLVDGAKLLQRYVGETIRVDQIRGEKVESVSGKLLSATGGLILMRPNGEVQSLSHYANIAFPSLPGGLITKPTLVWLVDAKRGGKHDAQVSYQTQGMTWWSDYNVILKGEANACSMDLAAWVTVVNQSGASYPNAQLKLVAGEVNRAPAAPTAPAPVAAMLAKVEKESAGFQESELFEYHLYTLGRRTELPQNSTKQLELFPAAVGMKCKRELVFTASPQPHGFWGSPISDQGYGATKSGTVGAWLEFENKEANGLGIPLPAGRVRVNQASKDGSLEFIGEDVIKHTPRNEILRIKLGEAFDVVGERKQIDYKIDTSAKRIDETIEISVRNRKKEAATIRVREYLYRWSTWAITEENLKHDKRDANTVDFVVNVPADSEQKIRYAVRYTW